LGHRLLVRTAGAAKVRLLTAKRRVVRRPQVGGAFDELVVYGSLLPVQLIDRPGGHCRLLQRFDIRCTSSRALGERVAPGDEIVERKLIQAVDVGL
jgi:hypothetical protein